jgi:hypothetical protein
MMKIRSARTMMIIGAILILANAVWITILGTPIVISSYPASSMSDLTGTWGRIVFGMPGVMLWKLVYAWLFLVIVDFILVLMLSFREKNDPYVAQLVLVLSVLSITMGGGFIIGMILMVISSMSMIEKKPLKETFIGKILRAARLDSSVYEGIGQKTDTLKNAVYTLVFINIMSGLGNGLYVTSAQTILNPLLQSSAEGMLFRGAVLPTVTIGGIVISYIGLAVVKWLIFSGILYFLLTKVAGINTGFESVSFAVSLAYSPVLIQLFMPLVLFNQPMLTGLWPLAFFMISNIWTGIALVVAVRKSGEISTSKTLGITALASSIYFAVNYTLIQPNFPVEGINFTIQPIAVIEFVLATGVFLGIFWGAFTKHGRT